MTITKEDIFEYLSELRILEFVDFIRELEERFDLPITLQTKDRPEPMVQAAYGGPPSAYRDIDTSPIEYDVVLKYVGPNGVKVLKEMRKLSNRSIKETKHNRDNLPYTLVSFVTKTEARVIHAAFTKLGAFVEIRASY